MPRIKGDATEPSSLTQHDIASLRIYLAQISTLNISIEDTVAEEMQNTFVRTRKERSGEGIDEAWLGTRIVLAKGLARIDARDLVSRQDWLESMQICLQWELRRKK